MLKIEAVIADSYAADLGLQQGDCLLMINGQPLEDLVDYYRLVESAELQVDVLREDGDIWQLEISKDPQEQFGVEVEHPEPRQCGNQCLFCFVHQLPRGMRRTLYIKDEDYRFSYLYGSYITLSNTSEKDLKRILEQHLSPLYISVHATDPDIRNRLLGSELPPILPLLKRLTDGGIELHCQIVICPGINDEAVLERSIADLAELSPTLASLAVVPVGLTAHRHGLPQLQGLTHEQAGRILDQIQGWQQRCLQTLGHRFVFAADELYLCASVPLPGLDDYESFPQAENGVGLIAQFRQQADEVLLEAEPLDLHRVTLVTGQSFAPELRCFSERMELRCGVQLPVVAVENRFFGLSVTVSGLLTGADLIDHLSGTDLGDGVLIPDVMLKDGERCLLDDVSLDELEARLKVPVLAVESNPWGVLDGLEILAADDIDIVRC